MNKKRKLKIKLKNILIIILLVTIISFTIIKTISYIKENPKEEKTDQQIKYEKKLKKLDNIDEKIKYFNYNKIDRYINYKENNNKLSLEEIITNVNIGLDQPHYENSTETTYLNKEYILVNKYHHLSENYIPKNLQTIKNNTEYMLQIDVESLGIKIEEEPGYAFKFKASEFADNSTIKNWSSKGVTIDFSPKFDWVNGGLKTEIDENKNARQYVCVKAGSTMTINYNVFGTDARGTGKCFKDIVVDKAIFRSE